MATAKINLLGEDIVLKGDGDAAYLERLAAEMEAMLKRLADDLQMKGQPTKVALLAAINLLDELTQLKAVHSRLERDTSVAVAQMVRRIEDKLAEDKGASA